MDPNEMRFSPDQLVFKVGLLTLENERLREISQAAKTQLSAALDAPCGRTHCDDCKCCDCEDGTCCAPKEPEAE
jgi:hypothetical protein